MKYRFVWLLLAALLLAGCAAPTAEPAPTPTEPAPGPIAELEPVTESEPVVPQPTAPMYIHRSESHQVAVSPTGEVLLDVDMGVLNLLYNEQGEQCYIVRSCTEGATEELWRSWVELYDLQGRFLQELPLYQYHVNGSFLVGNSWYGGEQYCYDLQTLELRYQGQRLPTIVGDKLLILKEDDTYQLMDRSGTVRQKIIPEGYTYQGVKKTGDTSCLVLQDVAGQYGLIDLDGSWVLPCAYTELRVSGGCAIVPQGDQWQAIDLQTGEVRLQTNRELRRLLPESLVVYDPLADGLLITDWQGHLLVEQVFWQVELRDLDEDGQQDVYFCRTRAREAYYYLLDGTMLTADSDEVKVSHLLSKERVIRKSDGREELVDMTTGSVLCSYEWIRKVWDSGLIGSQPEMERLLIGMYANPLGHARYDVLDWDGQVLLSDLQDCSYAGSGVFRCRKGFTEGLMTLDGRWLYQQSVFDTIEMDFREECLDETIAYMAAAGRVAGGLGRLHRPGHIGSAAKPAGDGTGGTCRCAG